MSVSFEEKRAFPRIKVRLPLRYQKRGVGGFDNSITGDISFKGVSFTNNRFIAPDTILALEISLLAKVLHPVARVAWSSRLPHSDDFCLGAEFTDIEQSEQDYLKDYLDMQNQKI